MKAGNIVIGRQYFLRQAATLLEFAQSTNEPWACGRPARESLQSTIPNRIEREAGPESASAGCRARESGL